MHTQHNTQNAQLEFRNLFHCNDLPTMQTSLVQLALLTSIERAHRTYWQQFACICAHLTETEAKSTLLNRSKTAE